MEWITDYYRLKLMIEEIIKNVYGYRVSCFSMDRNKLELLPQMGFTYDSKET